MEDSIAINWHDLFVPSRPLAEVAVRGSCIYLFPFSLLRVMRRQAGSIGLSDILLIVLIADAAQNGMAYNYSSITEGLALVITIVFWNFSIDWLACNFTLFETLLVPAPVVLIKNGRLYRLNMQREQISREELLSQLRQQGIDSIGAIKLSCLESDGSISVVKKSGLRKQT